MGFIEVDVIVATAGILEYRLSELGPRYQDKGLSGPIKELVRAPLLESTTEDLDGVTLTAGHPESGEVNPDNFQQTAVGFLTNPSYEEPTTEHRARQVATAQIRDRQAIEAYRAGDLTQFSLGYFVQFQISPGTHQKYGDYDTEQLDRLIHHCALVQAGRAQGTGPYGMRLDSNFKQQLTQQEISNMLDIFKRNDQQAPQGNQTQAGGPMPNGMNQQPSQNPGEGRPMDANQPSNEGQAMLQKMDTIASTLQQLMQAQQKQMQMMQQMMGDETEGEGGEGEPAGDEMDKENRNDWYRERRDIEDKADALDLELEDDFDNIDGMRAVVDAADGVKADRLKTDGDVRGAFYALDANPVGRRADGESQGKALRGGAGDGDTGASQDDGFIPDPNRAFFESNNGDSQ
jgi:hypothetical protein